VHKDPIGEIMKSTSLTQLEELRKSSEELFPMMKWSDEARAASAEARKGGGREVDKKVASVMKGSMAGPGDDARAKREAEQRVPSPIVKMSKEEEDKWREKAKVYNAAYRELDAKHKAAHEGLEVGGREYWNVNKDFNGQKEALRIKHGM
jgi:uncharacterized coiled-coil DUF342 family protein